MFVNKGFYTGFFEGCHEVSRRAIRRVIIRVGFSSQNGKRPRTLATNAFATVTINM